MNEVPERILGSDTMANVQLISMCAMKKLRRLYSRAAPNSAPNSACVSVRNSRWINSGDITAKVNHFNGIVLASRSNPLSFSLNIRFDFVNVKISFIVSKTFSFVVSKSSNFQH